MYLLLAINLRNSCQRMRMLSYVTADFTRLKSNNRTFLLLRLQKIAR